MSTSSSPISVLPVPQTASSGIGAHDWRPSESTRFTTADGAAYRYTFHATDGVEAAAHTVVVAPTGRGKTTLPSHLTAQALMLPDTEVFIFDRRSGTDNLTQIAGETYVRFRIGAQQGDERDGVRARSSKRRSRAASDTGR